MMISVVCISFLAVFGILFVVIDNGLNGTVGGTPSQFLSSLCPSFFVLLLDLFLNFFLELFEAFLDLDLLYALLFFFGHRHLIRAPILPSKGRELASVFDCDHMIALTATQEI